MSNKTSEWNSSLHYIFTISEFAELFGITTETLRYYDRIGLLKPAMVRENGWRYYSIRQYEKIQTIIELRKAGMSIGRIQTFFEGRSVETSVQILSELGEKVRERIERDRRLYKEISGKISFLNSLKSLPDPGVIFEREFPERSMITFGRRSGGREQHAMEFTRLTKNLKNMLPIFASNRVGVYSDQSILEPGQEFVKAYPMLLATKEDADEKYLSRIPAGRYVCMYYRDGILEKYHPLFEKIRAYLEEHEYRICGSILQTYEIDVTVTDRKEETLIEIQVPVSVSTGN